MKYRVNRVSGIQSFIIPSLLIVFMIVSGLINSMELFLLLVGLLSLFLLFLFRDGFIILYFIILVSNGLIPQDEYIGGLIGPIQLISAFGFLFVVFFHNREVKN